MEKYLITGANGFVGSNLISAIPEDVFIYAIGRQNKLPVRKNMEFISIDFSCSWDISLLPSDIDVVVHLAQSEYFRDFPDHAEDMFAVNTQSTLKLLEYARLNGIKKFVYASSGGIYGYGEEQFKEDAKYSSTGELGFYLGSKLCSEVITDSYTAYMDISVLRFFFVYGESQKETMLIPRLVNNIRNGKPVIIHGDNGGAVFNPIYISDAVDAILSTLKLNNSHKINIGGVDRLSIKRIAEIIGDCVGIKPVFEYVADKNCHNIVGDISKMRRLLGEPKVSFSKGISLLIESMKKKS